MNMKNFKLSTITIAMLVMSGVAQAELSDFGLYGKATIQLGKVKRNELETNSDGSYIGIKGQKELNNTGTSVLWQFEQGLDFASNDARNYDFKEAMRDAFVGFKQDGVGTIKAGKLQLPFTEMTQKLDLNKDQSTSIHNNFGRTGDLWNMGSLLIQTDKFYGVHGAMALSRAQKAVNRAAGVFEHTKIFSASLSYDGSSHGNGVFADIGYERANNDFASNDERKNFAVIAGYQFKNGLKIGAGFENIKYRANHTFSQNVTSITATMPIGSFDFGLNYIHLHEAKLNGENTGGKANIYTLKATYNMLENTTLSMNYSYLKNGSSSTYSFENDRHGVPSGESAYSYGIGVSHKF